MKHIAKSAIVSLGIVVGVLGLATPASADTVDASTTVVNNSFPSGSSSQRTVVEVNTLSAGVPTMMFGPEVFATSAQNCASGGLIGC